MRCDVLYISHLTTTAQYFTSNHISGTVHHTTSHIIPRDVEDKCGVEFGVMWNVLQWVPDVGCCALFILMWLRCGIRCNVEYVRYGVMLNVVSCNVR